MILGDINLSEIWIFFRYRSFPITINILLLFSWIYLLVVYFFNRKNTSYLFLALSTSVLFLKEVILFFTVRHVIFGQNLSQVNIDFTDWIILETVTTFLFVLCIANAYTRFPFKKKFDYPVPEAFKRLRVWAWVNFSILVVLVTIIYGVEQNEMIKVSFVLTLMAIMYLAYVWLHSNRIRINYTAFGGGWLNKQAQLMFLGYLGLTIGVFLGFGIMGILLSLEVTASGFKLSSHVREVPENYFHVFKTFSYIFYVIFVLLVLTKNYQIASSFRKIQHYISKEVNSIGGKLRQQVLSYEAPEVVIGSILQEAAAYAQAEFAFFCFYKKKEMTLSYVEHISESSKHREMVQKMDLSMFLKSIVDRRKHLILDEIEELEDSFKEHFSFLEVANTLEEIQGATDEKIFPCKVNSMLVTPIFSRNNLLYTIVLINKKEDYFYEWNEATSYGFLEALAEETRFLSDYLVDHDAFIELRNKAFDKRMGTAQNSILGLASQNIHKKLEKSSNFSLAWASAYKNLPCKTIVSMTTFQKKKPLVMLADINGETAARSYLAGMLHATFYQGAQHEKSIAGLMKKMNETLALTQHKNFVSATIYFYNEERRKFFFGNAAHTPILVFHIASNELISYDIDDPPLSVDSGPDYRDANTDINEGDIIITYSDELVSLKNEAGEDFFNPFKIGNIIKSMEKRDPQTIADQLALECEVMGLPVKTQPVFLVGCVAHK